MALSWLGIIPESHINIALSTFWNVFQNNDSAKKRPDTNWHEAYHIKSHQGFTAPSILQNHFILWPAIKWTIISKPLAKCGCKVSLGGSEFFLSVFYHKVPLKCEWFPCFWRTADFCPEADFFAVIWWIFGVVLTIDLKSVRKSNAVSSPWASIRVSTTCVKRWPQGAIQVLLL